MGHEDIVFAAFWHAARPVGTRDPLLAHGALLCSVTDLPGRPWATLADVIGTLQLPHDPGAPRLLVTDSHPGEPVPARAPAYLLGRLPSAGEPMLAALFLPLTPRGVAATDA